MLARAGPARAAAAYAAAAVAAGDKVPRGTTVAGVDVGGRSPDEAAAAPRGGPRRPGRRADPGHGRRRDRRRVDARRTPGWPSTTPPRSRRPAARSRWEPGRLWDYYTGGDDLDAVVDRRRGGDGRDRRRAGRVERHAARATAPSRFDDGGSGDPSPGRRAGRRRGGPRRPRGGVPPGRRDRRAVADGGPARHRRGRRAGGARRVRATRRCPARSRWSSATRRSGCRPATSRRRSAMKAEDGELVPELDEEKLRDAGRGRRQQGRRARRRDGPARQRQAEGGPGQAGRQLRAGRRQRRLPRPGARGPSGERELKVKATVAEADFTTADARALKIKRAGVDVHDVLPLRGVPQRQHRPRRRARRRHRAQARRDVLAQRHRGGADRARTASPRASSSATASSRRTSAAASRRWRPRRSTRCSSPGSRTSSTSRTRSTSTATRSAARPPSPGASVDLRFQNDTPYGVLIEAARHPQHAVDARASVTVSMYSTKYWDITTTTSDRYNYIARAAPAPCAPRTATRTPATPASTSTSPAPSAATASPSSTTRRSSTRPTPRPTR